MYMANCTIMWGHLNSMNRSQYVRYAPPVERNKILWSSCRKCPINTSLSLQVLQYNPEFNAFTHLPATASNYRPTGVVIRARNDKGETFDRSPMKEYFHANCPKVCRAKWYFSILCRYLPTYLPARVCVRLTDFCMRRPTTAFCACVCFHRGPAAACFPKMVEHISIAVAHQFHSIPPIKKLWEACRYV